MKPKSNHVTKTGSWPLAIVFLYSIFVVASAWAAGEVRVNGLVQSNQVGVGQPFPFTIEVSSTENVNPEEPQIPPINGVEVRPDVSTSSSTSTRMQQAGGSWEITTERKTNFTYWMTPTQKGEITIPSFKVVIGGKESETKPVRMRAVDEAVAQQAQPRQNQLPGMPGLDEILDDPEEMFNQLLRRRLGRQGGGQGQSGQHVPIDPPKNPNELLSIITNVDKREVYEGEQITVNWYILVRGNLLSLDRTKFPDLRGFWKEIIEEVPALQFSQEVLNGQVYRRALLASHALFPIKDGSPVIDEFKIKGQVQVPSGGFGAMGMGPSYTFTRSSERVPIKVLPLPKEGRPSDFSGAVGDFTVQAILENNILPVNQPFSLRIRFEGSGNAKLIEMPTINWPPGLEVYETKQESKFFKNGQSYKQFEIFLIPRQVGDIQTPEISVSLFDPKQKKYYSRIIEPISLKILQSSDPQALAAQRVDGQATTAQEGKGPVLPGPVTDLESPWEIEAPLAAASWALVLGFLGFFAYRNLGQRALKKDLYRIIKQRSTIASQGAQKGDYRKTGIVLFNLMGEVLGEISGQAGSDRQIAQMLELCPPSVRRNLGQKIVQLAENLQTLGFAPEEFVKGTADSAKLTSIVNEVRAILEQAVKEASTTQE